VPEADKNALAAPFAELERLILCRPASSLVTEYLAALAAEKVLDADTAGRVTAAYLRMRYGTNDGDDREVREASERLQAAALRVAAFPEETRQNLADRVRRRLQTSPTVEAPLNGSAAVPARREGSRLEWQSIVESRQPVRQIADAADSISQADANQQSEPKAVKGRREVRVSSLPLETATLVVVGLIVAGYVLRGGADQLIAKTAGEPAAATGAKVFAPDVWRHDDYWAANLRRRAQTEAAQKREKSARLAFELLISEVPRDAGALNDLAWLYLTSDDLSLRNPQRGLELALRAVAISRAPAILDTAAEGRFQNGQADEAVKLEREALDSYPRLAGTEDKRFWAVLQRQLQKFQSAVKTSETSATVTPRS
jgi:tetratricopeptide (TPR) repeat protein